MMGVFTRVMVLFSVFFMLQLVETKSLQEADLIVGEKQHGNNIPTSNELNCQVHKTYSQQNWLGKPLTFLAFIEYGERFSAIVGFQDQHMASIYDQIIISQEKIELSKIRKGNVNTTTFNQYLDTAGWTRIDISVNNHQFILKYDNTTALNYTIDQPVHELTVHGSNITICEDGSPTWIIEQGQSAIIPLEPSRQAVNPFIRKAYDLSLRSDDDFIPCLLINGNKICLELDDNIITMASTTKRSPLRAGKWDLYVEIVRGFIIIYQKIGSNREDITSFPIKGIRFIEVTSYSSNFSVTLNVFGLQNSPNLASITESGYDDNEAASTKAYGDSSRNHGTDIGIGILIGLLLCVTVVIGYKKFRVVTCIGYMKFRNVTCKAPWKKQIKDDATMESTKLNPETSSELIKL